MRGDVLQLRALLERFSRRDRAKIVNAGGEEDQAAGDNALHLACWKGHTAAARWLAKECGADLDAPGRAKLTPLHWAVKGFALSTMRWLLDEGADVRLRDDRDNTALDTCLHLLADMDSNDKDSTAAAELVGEDFEPDNDSKRARSVMDEIKRTLTTAQTKALGDLEAVPQIDTDGGGSATETLAIDDGEHSTSLQHVGDTGLASDTDEAKVSTFRESALSESNQPMLVQQHAGK